MISINSVCNEIIRKAISNNITITPLKLQKLLYLVYAYSLKENNGEPMFEASFNAWKFGPVCISVYEEFSSFGSDPITSYSKDAKGQSYFPNKNCESNTPFFNAFNTVWEKFFKLSSSDLIDLTHGKGSTAWAKATTNGHIDKTNILDDVKRGVYDEKR